MTTGIIVGICVVAICLIIVSFFLGKNTEKKSYSNTVGSAQAKARQIIDEAQKNAENAKMEALISAKEQILKSRNDLEAEIVKRRAEVADAERRTLKRDELSEKKAISLNERESQIQKKELELKDRIDRANILLEERTKELERVAMLSRNQAKEELVNAIRETMTHDIAKYIKDAEAKAREEGDKIAEGIIVSSIRRMATNSIAEATVATVQLPNDDMKGRIIGREGRNIRTLEALTGVECLIDDTPETVVLSGFDPVRREVARIALEKLILDGRIHPGRIEEVVEKSQKEVDSIIKQKGEEAVFEVGLHGLNHDLIKLIGRLHFRTSFSQNALLHSIEVAQLSGLMAAELGLDIKLAKRAGLLHDIGKAIDHEVESDHVSLGVDICKKYKERPEVINAVESHHGKVEPTNPISFIVGAADAISAARPGARKSTLENYLQRLKQLEDITNSYEGVERSFAVQAGREVRTLVNPEKVSDDEMVIMARNIARQIEDEMKYAGQIKVNVIRENRAVETAK